MKKFALPLLLFLALSALLAVGLTRNPREVPSPLVGRPAPVFNAPTLADAQRRFSPQALRGQVWLLNVWASWCTSCREEHATLLTLAREQRVPLIGLNYKDQPAAAREWLITQGDPYQLSVVDSDGRIGIDYGVYGVPETYLIDRSGIIRWKHTGPLTPAVLRDRLLPLLAELHS